MLDVTLRDCTAEDLPALADLDVEVFGPESYSRIVLRQLHEICRGLFRVAIVNDGQLAGYSVGALGTGTRDAWVLAVGVRPAFRQRGIARRLTLDLISQLAALGTEHVWLTVAPDNTPARRLYVSLGFSVAGLEPDYFGPRQAREVMHLMLPRALTSTTAVGVGGSLA
jgi:[ribosomal protein S18]-alanine N-acetyltransferase